MQERIHNANICLYSIELYIILTMISTSPADILTKIARMLLILVLGVHILKNKLILNKKSINYILWAISFLLYAFLGCFTAYSKNYAIDFTISLMYVIICNILFVIYLSRHTYYIPNVLKSIILGATLKATLCYVYNGLFCFLSSRSTEYGSANIIGFYCAFACVLCLYLRQKEKKYIHNVIFILNFCFLILSASRKSIIFLAVPIAVQVILKSKNPLIVLRNLALVFFSGIVMIIALFKIDFLYTMIGYRIESMINGMLGIGVTDGSTNTRMKLIAYGITWFKEKPIFGYGLSNFKPLWAYYRPGTTVYYAHNNYVELLVDCGIVGTILYYILHIKIILKGIKMRCKMTNMQLVLLGMLFSIVICDYGMVTYFDIFTQLIIALIYISFFCVKVSDKIGKDV